MRTFKSVLWSLWTAYFGRSSMITLALNILGLPIGYVIGTGLEDVRGTR